MKDLDLNKITFVGIDAHPTTHTALAINRFEEEKGALTFDNTKAGIEEFLLWLKSTDSCFENVIVGIEGGGNSRHALVGRLLNNCVRVYEINPLYTKQRRSFGTRPDKSDPADARAIAEVLIRKLNQLPRITQNDLSSFMLCLKKTVWFYEETTAAGVAIQNQLHQLKREAGLSVNSQENKILGLIIREKEAELRRVRKTQAKCKQELGDLLKIQGINLTSIRGISTVLAAKIVAHAGGIERFANLDGFVRYAGISPREKSSGKTKRNVKNPGGNRKLNHAFYLTAMVQLRWSQKAREYFDKKVKEGKTKKHALKCLMKRVACIVYGMLKSGELYRV